MVKIVEHKIQVGDTSIPLLSGEVHYWRLDPHNWRRVLKRIKELGLNVVATYVCWDFHEIAPGAYDFRGETDSRRNLTGFLELLAEEDFWIILRPGPYIYSEWNNGGVPDHAAKYHRLDSAFLRLAEHYMAAVVEVAKPYLATQGGRIIVWQADNEIDPWPHLYTEELGLGQKAGPFQAFLREKYTDIDALNRAWRTNYTDFESARAVSGMFPHDPILMSRYNDYRSFIHWYVNKVAAWAVNTYREMGVNVPILLNTYSGVGTQRWADMEKIADIVGPDIYPSREFLHRTGEHRHILEAGRYTRTYSRLPYIPEWESGIWHDWLEEVGALTPNHYRLLCFSALSGGIAGWNWYMLVNRDNWYQSPINEWGYTRPDIFHAFQQIVSLYRELDPTTLTRITHTAVTFDALQRSTERPGQDILNSFYQADIDYDFFDLSQGTTDKNFLFYAGGTWVSESGQKRLLEFVENGGHLVCIGVYPRMDEHFHPLNLLNIPDPAGIVSGSPTRMNLTIFDRYSVESPHVALYEAVPGEPVQVERHMVKNQPSEELHLQFNLQTGTRYTIGYTARRGQGQLTVIGMQPSPELLIALHQHFQVAIPCRSRTPGVTSTLFQRGQERYVIATNPGAEAKVAEIELAPDGRLHIALSAKDGAVVNLNKNSY